MPAPRRAVLWAVASGLALAGTTTTAAAASASPPPDHVEQWWYDAMKLDEVHEETRGEGAVVAVLDGYLDTSVPDLRGADIEVRRGCDDARMGRPGGSSADHGTAMTTLVVGQGTGNADGGRGVLGVAPGATVRFYTLETDPNGGRSVCDTYSAGRTLVKAARQGADVISLSVSGFTSGFAEYVTEATELGAVVVIAAEAISDEYDTFSFPAASPGAVAVYAGDSSARPWDRNPPTFESAVGREPNTDVVYGEPTLVAPGIATPAGGFDDGGTWYSGAERTGTSGATAITAGAFALLASKYPEATNNQLIQSVIRNNDGKGETQPIAWTPDRGWGNLQVNNALDEDPSRYPDVNPLVLEREEAAERFAAVDGTDAEAPEPADGAATAPATEAAATTATSDAGSGGTPVTALAAGGGVGLVVLLGAVLLARRRRSQDGAG